MNKQKAIIILTVIFVVFLLVGALIQSAKRDVDLMKSQERYEDCVEREYGVTLFQWRAEYGSNPECL